MSIAILMGIFPSLTDAKSPQEYVEGRVLVQPKPGLPRQVLDKILNSQGARAVDKIYDLNIHILKVPPQAEEAVVRALSRNPHISFAEVDLMHELSLLPNDPISYDQSTNTWPAWHLPKIEVPAAWDEFVNAGEGIGEGVTVAVLDTGFDSNHPDLGPKLIPGWNTASGNNDTSPVHGHGTQTAGVVGAASNNGIGVASIAWDSPIMPIRVTNSSSGSASTSAIASGITWAADHGARVASISYGLLNGPSLNTAAQYMRNRGGLVLVAAGNNGTDEGYSDNPYVISVAATTSSDNRASFSNYGNYIDVSAPGSGIQTTTWGGGYGGASGTSFSCPTAAAIVGLIMSADPFLTPTAVENILEGSADDLGSAGWDVYYGYGRVNAKVAVQMAMEGSSGNGDDTQAPTVSISFPAKHSTVEGLVNVDVSAHDNIDVTRVVLYADGALIGEDTVAPYEFSWDSTQQSDGSVELIVLAYDAASNEGTSGPHPVTIDNVQDGDTTPPTVVIESPAHRSKVSGDVEIHVSASDNVAVTSIELFIDDQLVQTSNAMELTYNWQAPTSGKSRHSIKAVAHDEAGNSAQKKIQVSVGEKNGNGKGRK